MVKEKPNSTRIYDDDGYRRRAACICVRSDTEEEVLLVTSSRRPELWIVPGGGVEPDEEPSVTAMREVLEEAGVMGNLGRSLGVFENTEHKHRTEVFVMSVTEELEEWEDSRAIGRKRQWFAIEEALSQLALHKPTQRHYIMQLQTSRCDVTASSGDCPAVTAATVAGGLHHNNDKQGDGLGAEGKAESGDSGPPTDGHSTLRSKLAIGTRTAGLVNATEENINISS